jgi:hypothetical protein
LTVPFEIGNTHQIVRCVHDGPYLINFVRREMYMARKRKMGCKMEMGRKIEMSRKKNLEIKEYLI